MKAAETSASRAMALCTPLTVVSRSSTTLEIDTFINDVSTTRTNIAAASSRASRFEPVAGASSDMAARLPLPHLGDRDDGQAGADADQPLRARELDRGEDPLQEVQRGGQDD